MMGRREMLMRLNSLVEATATGNPVTFSTTVARPLVHSLIGMEPVQSGSGDPAPDNVRPITGWTGCKVTHTGKNLLALPFVQFENTSTDITNYFPIKNGTYIFSFAESTADSWRYIVRLKDKNGDVLSDNVHNPSGTVSYRDSVSGYTNGVNITQKSIVLTIVEDCFIRLLYWNTGSTETTFSDCQLELGSTASSYAPYSGESVEVTFPAVGKNLLDINSDEIQTNAYNITKIPNLLKPSTTYAYSISGTTSYTYGLYLSNGGDLAGKLANNVGAGQSITFTTPDSMTQPYLVLTGNVDGAGYESPANILPQIEEGSVTTYEPFTNTVYGGTVDLATGTLTVDRVMVDLGTLEWNYITNDGTPYYFRARPVGRKTGPFNVIASTLKTSATAGTQNLPDCGIIGSSSSLFVFVRYDAYQDASAFTTAMSGVQLCYELAESKVFHLTPQQITALIGDNVLWSDTNADCTITYLKKK